MSNMLLKMITLKYFKLMKYFFVWPKSPIQLIHFVTSKCNAKCEHCFYWKNLNKNNDLSLDQINEITKHQPSLLFLLISGGEPFLRKDLVNIISAYYKNTGVIEIFIPTNGLLTQRIITETEKILKICSDIEVNIEISIDGPKEIHDRIRGVKGCFEKAENTIKELRKLKPKYPNLKISIISTLTKSNQKKIEEFYFYVKDKMKPDVFSLNMVRASPKDTTLKDIEVKYYERIHELKCKSLPRKGLKNWMKSLIYDLRTRIILETIKRKKYIMPCYAAKHTAVLSEDGKIFPCEMLNKPIADIKNYNYNFKKLWSSKITRDCSRSIISKKCFCTHECFYKINILYNPRYIIKEMLKKIFK